MNELVSGALVMGYFVAGLFFLRFWKETRDRLFGIFAAAFWLLGVQRALLALLVDDASREGHVLFYLVRLVAFLLILWAIVDKNRGTR
ncbi:MAG TPA: DUF5985 family protein [Longimicrobium sp.]|nr:DUF5985 family protein [Longimicrobium sp.]